MDDYYNRQNIGNCRCVMVKQICCTQFLIFGLLDAKTLWMLAAGMVRSHIFYLVKLE